MGARGGMVQSWTVRIDVTPGMPAAVAAAARELARRLAREADDFPRAMTRGEQGRQLARFVAEHAEGGGR